MRKRLRVGMRLSVHIPCSRRYVMLCTCNMKVCHKRIGLTSQARVSSVLIKIKRTAQRMGLCHSALFATPWLTSSSTKRAAGTVEYRL